MEARGRYPVRRAAVPTSATGERREHEPAAGRMAGSYRHRVQFAQLPRWTSRRPRDYSSTTETTLITPKTNSPLIVAGPVQIGTRDGRGLAVPPQYGGRPPAPAV